MVWAGDRSCYSSLCTGQHCHEHTYNSSPDKPEIMATTRVFFDVTADGTPLGKIIMEVSVAVSVSSPRYLLQTLVL